MVNYSFRFMSILLLLTLTGLPATVQAEQEIIARGDGVEVTRDFARMIADFYKENTAQRPTSREMIRSGVEHWLFAREAVLQGIAQAQDDPGKLEAREVIALYRMYLGYLLHQEEIGEKILLSYYRAFPEKFRNRQARQNPEIPFSGDITEEYQEYIPFDQVKEQIKGALLASMRSRVRSAAFADLMSKYQVRINY